MSATVSPASHATAAGLSPRTLDLILAAARCWIVIAPLVYFYDLWLQTADGLTNGTGRPFGDDFINYWSAAKLTVLDRAHEIYDFSAFNAFQETVVGADVSYFGDTGPLNYYHYSYPPTMILLSLPIAAIPYVPGLFVWLAASWYAFYRALRLATPEGAMLLTLALPALTINAMAGQNGAWTAALLGGGLMLLNRQPIVSGIFFGLLIYKPHLGLLLPVALLAGRQWKAFVAAGITVAVLVTASVAVFGVDLWSDYLRNATTLRHLVLEDGSGVYHRMVSVFFSARRLGAGVELAYAIQLVSALCMAAVVALVWFRDAPMQIRYSLLILGVWLTTPYLLDYDLMVGAFVVAWLASYAAANIPLWRPVLMISALILVLPLISAPIGQATGYSIGGIFLMASFLILTTMLPAALRELSPR